METNESKAGLRYSVLDLLIVAILAAVSGVVNVFVVSPYARFIEGVVGPFGLPLNTFLFVFWGIIASFITGKPLAALIWSLLDGIVQLLVGSGSGRAVVLFFVLFQGLGLELGLALWGYRRRLGASATAGGLACVAFMIAFLYVLRFAEHPLGTQLGLLAAEAIVGAIGAGLLGYYIYQGLERAGVVSRHRPGGIFEVAE